MTASTDTRANSELSSFQLSAAVSWEPWELGLAWELGSWDAGSWKLAISSLSPRPPRERLDAVADLVANLTHPFERPPFGSASGQSSPAVRHERALVAAAHRDQQVGVTRQIDSEPLRLSPDRSMPTSRIASTTRDARVGRLVPAETARAFADRPGG